MAVVMRAAAVYMLLLAVVVAGHFLANQFYDPALEGTSLTVWRVIDPLMVAGLVMVLVFAFARKRRLDANPAVDREYLETNVVFYYSAALLLALLWNWFGFEWVEPSNSAGWIWTVIDVTLPLLLASTGIRLLRSPS
ncbi:MAG: hypothetical protein OXG37_14960 [Actinomycetia bacterium]|nr:hypothetical protein [Actinomycetes bacterium]